MEIHDLKLLYAFAVDIARVVGVPDVRCEVESTTVYLDWGKTSGVQVGDSFQVTRPG